ncbi:putative tricarboxylic transport membrane protein [Paenibacillus castaneae]|uniref:tripartite tricarboxylate transporter permease n=1 Tax=Paenibacillus castaneae TaxID=474957 RepID=UPI000C9C5FDD|nr:tripartite tricarboxylate transporter permease [Paenibacillus castaneae]NIK77816.1 putative tricarboxylic transport membrane protein [Paenibacillus castaneae]
MAIQYILDTFTQLLSPINLLTLVLSVFFGLLVGVLPGLTSTMAVALLTGLTYGIAPETAILSLIGVYVGAISGGVQTAILLNIPGTPAAAATALDGYKIGQRGEAGLGIFLGNASAFLGTIFGAIAVLLLTPLLSVLSLKFGSWEFFLLALFGVIMCGSLASGGDTLKGWISGILGLFVAQIGLDALNSYPRFSYGNVDLMAGLPLIPIMIGLFGFPEIVNSFKNEKVKAIKEEMTYRVRKGISILISKFATVIRSGFMGVGVGVIPGVGEDVAGWLSYWAARVSSKNKEEFGKGAYEGVIAAETGVNATIGGNIIPVLTLAVPGSTSSAVLLAALWLHGYRPGPLLMTETPGFIYTISIYLVVSAFVMLILGLIISRYTVKLLQIDKRILMPIIFVICAVGSFVIDNKFFSVYIMFIFGIIGLLLSKTKFPAAPFLLGVVLGPMADSNLRRSLVLSDGSLAPLFTRPICLVFVIIIAIMILAQFKVFSKLQAVLFKKKANES